MSQIKTLSREAGFLKETRLLFWLFWHWWANNQAESIILSSILADKSKVLETKFQIVYDIF